MSLVAFFFGVYVTGGLFVFLLSAGDPDGRFKYRYAFLWPIYIRQLFRGEYPE